jgi:hypothetical protein
MSKEHIYNDHLKELHGSNFEMATGEPDISHWMVLAGGHQEIGRVSELLFDEVSRKVKYLVIDMDGKPLNLVSRNIMVPIGLAELRRREKLVLVPELTVGHIASLPSYEKGKIPLETESEIRSVFAPSSGIVYEDEKYTESDGRTHREHGIDDQAYRPNREVVERISLKEEIQENIEKVKESVKKMESDVEKLSKHDI